MELLAILEQLRDFDTALLANTIGYIDPTPADQWYMGGSIGSLTPTIEPTVGVAYTLELDSSSPEGSVEPGLGMEQYSAMIDHMSRSGIPSIVVIKTVGSRPDHECVMGDGMAKEFYAAGCLGAVTDGRVRDVKGMLTTPFAAYAKGTTIHHCSYRFRSFGKPVEVGGIQVSPGDVLHANCEGVIRLPPACLEILPEAAVRMRAFEHEAHCALRRTDLGAVEKRAMVMSALAKYGFAKH
jgi:4-hydroxy-4-methyl-2-oxoglutarate aldolase